MPRILSRGTRPGATPPAWRARCAASEVGGFLGAWLGGKAFDLTGSYDWMWYADIVLALGAALVHLPIVERRPLQQPA